MRLLFCLMLASVFVFCCRFLLTMGNASPDFDLCKEVASSRDCCCCQRCLSVLQLDDFGRAAVIIRAGLFLEDKRLCSSDDHWQLADSGENKQTHLAGSLSSSATRPTTAMMRRRRRGAIMTPSNLSVLSLSLSLAFALLARRPRAHNNIHTVRSLADLFSSALLLLSFATLSFSFSSSSSTSLAALANDRVCSESRVASRPNRAAAASRSFCSRVSLWPRVHLAAALSAPPESSPLIARLSLTHKSAAGSSKQQPKL